MHASLNIPGEVAVFADTNLGTRIAFNAHQDITAGALKRDFERVHFTCLPDTGEVLVNGLMVKRKSCFYYLPDSLPIKFAFPGLRRIWFLHVEVRHLKCLCIPCLHHDMAVPSKPQELMTCHNEGKARCNSEEKRVEGFHENYTQNAANGMPEGGSCRFEDRPTGTTNKSHYVMPENKDENLVELPANSMQGSLSKMSTQVISVTGIINKYFSGFKRIDNFSSSSNSDVTSRDVHSEIEVQSKTRAHSCSKRQIDSLQQCTPKTPPHVLHAPSHVYLVPKSSGDKNRRSKVGKRLLVAARSLGVSITERSPTLTFCRFKDRKLLEYKSQINGSVFAISDSDS